MDHVLLLLVLLCTSGLQKRERDSSPALGDVKLVGGSGRCSGQLMVKRQKSWDDVADHNWDLRSAGAVCRQLDCGSVVQTRSTDVRAGSWSITLSCLKPESTMRKCLRKRSLSNNVEITCSDSVRLVNGSGLCSGALKVKSSRSWSSVCEGDFDLQDAQVVCRELGCGAPLLFWGRLDAGGEEASWAQAFHCAGDESALRHCNSSGSAGNSCSSGKAAALTCSEPDSVRLVGGYGRCAGELQVKHNGGWSRVDAPAPEWNLRVAEEVCRQLGCGSAVSTGRSSSYGKVMWVGTACLQSQSALRECVFTKYHTSNTYLEINCSDSVRLLGGSSRCSGRLQVKSRQVWSSACEGDISLQGAEGLCGELGCGAALGLRVPETPAWSREFHCGGRECGRSPSPGDACSSGKSVVLTCAEPHEVRLVGGSGHCSGEPELKLRGVWRRVTGGHWDLMSARVVCKQLDCGSALSVRTAEAGQCNASLVISSSCGRADASVRECATTWPEHKCYRVEINCSESLRLVKGTSWCSGRLEVKSNRLWSSVCGADFDRRDAAVACRELGCEPPVVFAGGLFGDAEAPVWSEGFQCEGNESALVQCGRSGSAGDTCSPGEAVGLTCSEPDSVRLFKGTTRCDGTLQMRGQGQWRPVISKGFDWNRKVASAACRQLGCGLAISTKQKETYSKFLSAVWSLRHPCGQSDDLLWECLVPENVRSLLILEVTCSGILAQPDVSFSASDAEVSAEQLRVLLGSSFTISCCIRPQYPGGSFQLVLTNSDGSQSRMLPAVNHAAHFLFPAADHTLRGEYRCLYHVYIFYHNLSSESRPLHLTLAASLTDLIIRVVLVTLLLLSASLFFYCKATRGSSELPYLDQPQIY